MKQSKKMSASKKALLNGIAIYDDFMLFEELENISSMIFAATY